MKKTRILFLLCLCINTFSLFAQYDSNREAQLSDSLSVLTDSMLVDAPNAVSKKDIIKKGISFGPLPVVAFDMDKGFQYGALLNIYDFGDGSFYPTPRQQWYIEASAYTKGSKHYIGRAHVLTPATFRNLVCRFHL